MAGVALALLVFAGRSEAVENLVTGAFNTTAPTASDIPNWGTGWPATTTATNGWDYVGLVNGCAGEYLGNGWVITAGHVGAGTYTLGGVAYSVIPSSIQSIPNTSADITLFQIYSPPSLPALPIATSAPTALSSSRDGSPVAMIGYGGGKSWGLNSVTTTSRAVQVGSYLTTDFETAYGTTTIGSHSAVNNYAYVVGDSGGGGFVYKTTTGKWELSGMNEAIDSSHNGYLVQLSSYASQINTIKAAASAPGLNTMAASGLSQTGATLNGLVNGENFSTSVSFEYGPTTGYGSSVAASPSVVSGTAQTAVSFALSGLSPGTTYHFRVKAVNSVGTSYGADGTFTTSSTALQAWRQTYYGGTDNSGNAADAADPYGTGVSNLLVFAFLGPNQDPARVTPNLLPQAQIGGGNLFYNFTQPAGVSGITYGAEWSATLQSNDWHAISDTGSGSQHIFSVGTGDNARLFIRLRATSQ